MQLPVPLHEPVSVFAGAPTAHDANVCVHGNCRLDQDCGPGGYCSPSAVTLDPFCTTGVPQGSVGYFCHTPEDVSAALAEWGVHLHL